MEDFRRIRMLFEAALEQPDHEGRRRFLESACPGDLATRGEVERILRHYDQVANTLGSELPRFGPYQSTRVIGRGGMGLVYEAHRADGQFERRVAIKVAAGTLAAGASRQDLRAERQTLANLIHPNIAQLYDGGLTPAGEPYLVVEYVEGEHLDAHCEKHQLPPAERLRLLAPILDAVEFTHRHGVIHQDLKPSNILVNTAGQPKLLDFGVSRLLDAQGSGATKRLTPAFASPEAVAGGPIDVRADVYSLGLIYSKLLGSAAKPAILRKATAPRPEDRYGSVAELRRALYPGSRWRLAAVALAAALALMAGALWMRREPAAAGMSLVSPPEGSWREPSLAWGGEWMAFSGGDTPASVRDIWVSHGDGSGAEPLFRDAYQDQDPAISSDGRYVAFHSSRHPPGIHEFDRATRTIRSVAPGGHLPRYSPDGRWLLYATADDRPDRTRVVNNLWFIIPARGGAAATPRSVAVDLAAVNGIWSPDSQSVLLQVKSPDRIYANTLWRRRLDSETATLAAEWAGQDMQLCGISPDGQSLFGTMDGKAVGRIRLPWRSSMAPEQIAKPGELLMGCTADRTGRVYLQQQGYVSRHYFLPQNSPPGSAPQPLPGPEGGYGVSSASNDGRVAVFRHAVRGDSIAVGPFGKLPFFGSALLSGDGDSAWVQTLEGVRRMTLLRLPDLRVLAEYPSQGARWSVTIDGKYSLGPDATVPRPITLTDLVTGTTTVILRHPQGNLYRARQSSDGRWVVFSASDPVRGLRIYLAPYRQTEPVPVEEWIEAAEGTAPALSLTGDRLAFTSKRDGFWCVYEQALDAQKRPAGDPRALAHLHGDYSAGELPGSAFTIIASADGLRFSLGRQRHYVWDFGSGAVR